jgi:hypothetical protein
MLNSISRDARGAPRTGSAPLSALRAPDVTSSLDALRRLRAVEQRTRRAGLRRNQHRNFDVREPAVQRWVINYLGGRRVAEIS